MAIENGIITSTISTSDVSAALGEGSLDTGTLCVSRKINPWAKHKPVVSRDLFTGESTYLGTNGNCGFNLPTLSVSSSNIASLIECYEDEDNEWIYAYNDAGPYRLNDFVSYKHDATPPVNRWLSSSDEEHDIENDGGTITYNVQLNTPILGDGYNLRFADFGAKNLEAESSTLNEWFFGAAIVDSAGAVVALAVGDADATIQVPIGVGGASVSLDVSALTLGDYTVYPFLADRVVAQGASVEFKAVPMPIIKPRALKIVEYGDFEWYATAIKQTSGAIVVNVFAWNQTGRTISLANNEVRYYGDPTSSSYTTTRIVDMDVAVSNTYVQIARVSFIPDKYLGRPYVIVSLGGGRFVSDQIGVKEMTPDAPDAPIG